MAISKAKVIVFFLIVFMYPATIQAVCVGCGLIQYPGDDPIIGCILRPYGGDSCNITCEGPTGCYCSSGGGCSGETRPDGAGMLSASAESCSDNEANRVAVSPSTLDGNFDLEFATEADLVNLVLRSLTKDSTGFLKLEEFEGAYMSAPAKDGSREFLFYGGDLVEQQNGEVFLHVNFDDHPRIASLDVILSSGTDGVFRVASIETSSNEMNARSQ